MVTKYSSTNYTPISTKNIGKHVKKILSEISNTQQGKRLTKKKTLSGKIRIYSIHQDQQFRYYLQEPQG